MKLYSDHKNTLKAQINCLNERAAPSWRTNAKSASLVSLKHRGLCEQRVQLPAEKRWAGQRFTQWGKSEAQPTQRPTQTLVSQQTPEHV